MEEQLISKILEILKKDKITIKGQILSIGNKQIKLSKGGSQKITTRITQLR